MKSIYDFDVKDASGKEFPMRNFAGKVTLVVNTASMCGFTPQYTGLEELQQKFSSHGFTVVGFPCNQFGGQEPGSNEQIQDFCITKFAISFPIMAKVDVNGKAADPLWKWLTSEAPGLLGTEAIKWNFTKFLVGKNGQVIRRYSPQTEPRSIAKDIEEALQENSN